MSRLARLSLEFVLATAMAASVEPRPAAQIEDFPEEPFGFRLVAPHDRFRDAEHRPQHVGMRIGVKFAIDRQRLPVKRFRLLLVADNAENRCLTFERGGDRRMIFAEQRAANCESFGVMREKPSTNAP